MALLAAFVFVDIITVVIIHRLVLIVAVPGGHHILGRQAHEPLFDSCNRHSIVTLWRCDFIYLLSGPCLLYTSMPKNMAGISLFQNSAILPTMQQ